MSTTPIDILSVDASAFERIGEQAQVLRLAWNAQIVNRQDLVTWADSWIPRQVTTRELSVLADLAVPTFGDDVRYLLDEIAVACTDVHVLAFVGVVAQAHRAGRITEDEAARRLYYLAIANDFLYPEFYSFWDELDLARDQHIGDLQEVRSRFEKCLTKHARLADWLQFKSM